MPEKWIIGGKLPLHDVVLHGGTYILGAADSVAEADSTQEPDLHTRHEYFGPLPQTSI